MNIVCVICRELLTPSEDIFFTPCGHVFHFPCLTQWLERSKSCPQCREKVSQSKIHRIYFNLSNNDTIEEDSTTLQSRVESLQFQILLRDKDINHYLSKSETLDKQVHGLRKEVLKLENEIESRNSANFALHEQLKLLKEDSKLVDSQRKEIEKLRRQNELNRNVQTLVNSSYDCVDEMIKETRDPHTFITYIKVLKQELLSSTNKRRDQRTMIKNLQHDISSLTRERNLMTDELLRKKNLEEELAISESKRIELERQLKVYREKAEKEQTSQSNDSTSEVNTSIEKVRPKKETLRRLYEGSDDAPIAKKIRPAPKPKFLTDSPIVISEDSADEGAVKKPASKAKENEENSPYLRLKSKGISALKELHAQRSAVGTSHSIFGKKRLAGASSAPREFGPMTFDGFGGRSKPEIFPVMNLKQKKPSRQDAVKAKKAKLDDGNKKLGDFLINLT